MREDYGEALRESKQAKEANIALRDQLEAVKKAAREGGQVQVQDSQLQAEHQRLDRKLKQLRQFQLPLQLRKEDFTAAETVKVSQAVVDECVQLLV